MVSSMDVLLTSTSAFEYLAATAAGRDTNIPGPTSFTSALIFALEELVKDRTRFTSIDLVRKIRADAPDFPKHQVPVLSDRKENSYVGRIFLQPMPKTTGSQAIAQDDTAAKRNSVAKSRLTLHFDLDATPTTEQIEELGVNLNKVIAQYRLPVTQVRWGGWRPSIFHLAVEGFKDARRRSSTKSLQQLNLAKTQAWRDSQSQPVIDDSPSPTWDAVSDRLSNTDAAGFSVNSSASSTGDPIEELRAEYKDHKVSASLLSPTISILDTSNPGSEPYSTTEFL